MATRTNPVVLMCVLNDVENDNRVLKCARTLSDLGYDITIFGVSHKRAQRTVATKVINGIPVYLFPNPRFTLRHATVRWWNLAAVKMHLLAGMWSSIERLKPDILHTHDFHMLRFGYEVVQRRRRNGSPIYWVHDLHEYVAGLTSVDEDIRRAAVQDQEELIQLPDMLLTVSPRMAQRVAVEHALRREPVVLLNSNPSWTFKPDYQPTIRQKLGLGAGVPLAVYTGGVSRPRGVHTLIDVLPRYPELHVALVTNNVGPYVDSLTAAATAAGAIDRLHYLPYVAPDEVPSFIRDATLAVHPMQRFENAEVTIPNKTFDYSIGRVPQVVSDCKSMAEIVSTWKLGEVFKSEDVADLERAIRKVVANREDYVQAITGSEFLARFNWEEQGKVLGDVYRQAVSEIEFAARVRSRSQTLWDKAGATGTPVAEADLHTGGQGAKLRPALAPKPNIADRMGERAGGVADMAIRAWKRLTK